MLALEGEEERGEEERGEEERGEETGGAVTHPSLWCRWFGLNRLVD